jgi:hypothetical protein
MQDNGLVFGRFLLVKGTDTKPFMVMVGRFEILGIGESCIELLNGF